MVLQTIERLIRATGLSHNRKCWGGGPINDNVLGTGHLHQLAFKHKNCLHSHLALQSP